jgi:hypothetical protein
MEEPLPADAPLSDWQALAAEAPMPLAAGENLGRQGDFEAVIAAQCLGFLQFDLKIVDDHLPRNQVVFSALLHRNAIGQRGHQAFPFKGFHKIAQGLGQGQFLHQRPAHLVF